MGRHSLEEGSSIVIRKDRNNENYFIVKVYDEEISIPLTKLDDLIYGLQSFEVTTDTVEIY